jgi:hypothetical protein
MKMSKYIAFMLLITLSPVHTIKIYQSLGDICTESTAASHNKFIELPQRAETKWDALEAFRIGVKLGQGSFGLVKKCSYLTSENEAVNIALKKMSPKEAYEVDMILLEISALKALGNSNYIPRLYGCVYQHEKIKQASRQIAGRKNYLQNRLITPAAVSKQPTIYMAQELLSSDLSGQTYKNFINTLSVHKSLKLWIQMFKGVRDMWVAGLVHNDIKPANMMTNKDRDRIYLIDVGLVSFVGKRVIHGGTPIFMSPPKFKRESIIVSQKDDFYSIALSIVDIESKNSDNLFGRAADGTYISNTCYQSDLSATCRRQLASNVKKILERSGYGKYEAGKKDVTNINLTTLLYDMVIFDHFSMDVYEVIQAIQRMIDETGEVVAPKVADKEELKRIEGNLKQANKIDKQFNEQENKLKLAIAEREKKLIDFEANNLVGGVMAGVLGMVGQDKLKDDLMEKNAKKKELDKEQVKYADIQAQYEKKKLENLLAKKKELEKKNLETEFHQQNPDLFVKKKADYDVLQDKPDESEVELVKEAIEPEKKKGWEVIFEEKKKGLKAKFEQEKNEIEKRNDRYRRIDMELAVNRYNRNLENAKVQAKNEFKKYLEEHKQDLPKEHALKEYPNDDAIKDNIISQRPEAIQKIIAQYNDKKKVEQERRNQKGYQADINNPGVAMMFDPTNHGIQGYQPKENLQVVHNDNLAPNYIYQRPKIPDAIIPQYGHKKYLLI